MTKAQHNSPQMITIQQMK